MVAAWGRASRTPSAVAIGTAEGMLLPQVVGLEGRRPMPIADFLRGQPAFLGARLGD